MIWEEGKTRVDGIAYAKTLDGAHPGVRQFDCMRACYYRDHVLYLLHYPNQDELDYYQGIIDYLIGRVEKQT